MPNEFVIKNGFISKGNSIVEGGLTATTISASTYSNLPSPSITVGTSQLTSGTDTRVLFQSGTTLQQDGNFSYNTTQKRLILQANGTAVTNIPLQILNNAGSANLVEIAGNNTFTFLSTPGKAVLSNVSNGGPLLTFGRDYTNQEVVRISGNDYPSISLTKLNTTSSISIGTVANGISMNYNAATGDDSFQIQNSFHNVFQVIGNPNSASASFRLGSISSNANFFNLYGPNGGGTGINATQLFNVNTNGNVGIGMVTTGARLDVKAQGALSTDIAFRVRNSTDTANIFYVLGNGNTGTPWGDSYTLQYGDTSFGATIKKNGQYGTNISIFQFAGAASSTMNESGFFTNGNMSAGSNTSTNYRYFSTTGYGTESDHILLSQPQNGTRKASILINTNYSAGISYNTARFQVETYVANSVDRTKFNFWASNGNYTVAPTIIASLTCKSNFLLGTPTEDINDSNTIYVPTGTTPTSSITNGFKLYSTPVVVGNAAPHFRTENGSIIKLYQETTGVTSSTLVSNGGTTLTDTDTFDGYTLKQVVKALRNLGVLQ